MVKEGSGRTQRDLRERKWVGTKGRLNEGDKGGAQRNSKRGDIRWDGEQWQDSGWKRDCNSDFMWKGREILGVENFNGFGVGISVEIQMKF